LVTRRSSCVVSAVDAPKEERQHRISLVDQTKASRVETHEENEKTSWYAPTIDGMVEKHDGDTINAPVEVNDPSKLESAVRHR